MKKLKKIAFVLSSLFVSALFFGCQGDKSSKYKTFTIWTDREEFVSYSELFNSIQSDTKAIIVYKPRLANSLPPARDEEKPDLIIGSWLKNKQTRKNFRSIENVLSADKIDVNSFYSPLLEYGRTAGTQYLLPVSFNLPLMIFSKQNEKLLPDQYSMTINQIKTSAAQFNHKNKQGFYTNMGYGPSWNADFLYTVTKKFGPCFEEKDNAFTWNQEKLDEATTFLKNWIVENNETSAAEQDFEFKYLYTPTYRQIAQDRTLFAYTTSKRFFNISFEQLGNIDFRWLTINQKLPIEDDIVLLGIYKKARNPNAAVKFVKWFFQEENQKQMLERQNKMQLDSQTFGIASGFSSVINVNERLFPAYYKNLLGNLPIEQMLESPQSFPTRWQSLKERVIFPYLKSAVETDEQKKTESLDALLSSWTKQFD